MIHTWGGDENLTRSDYLKASTTAGAFAGLVGGSLRNAVSGRGHVLPGVIVWSLLGAGGQVFADRLAARTPTHPPTPTAAMVAPHIDGGRDHGEDNSITHPQATATTATTAQHAQQTNT